MFDDIGGKFNCRLREQILVNRNTADGHGIITFKLVKLEAEYDPEVAKKLTVGRLLALQNVKTKEGYYSIYELADRNLMHYSMLTLDLSQPAPVRREFMDLIEKDWEGGSKNTWIEIVAAPTGYLMKVEGEPKYLKGEEPLLVGSTVQLLDDESLRSFFCYRGSTNTLGNLMIEGEKPIPLTVNMENLVHYHAGVFGYTGAGKSNLLAMMIRKALETMPDLKVVIVDVSSEYAMSLLDVIYEDGRVIILNRLKGSDPKEQSSDFIHRHVMPPSLALLGELVRQVVYRIMVDERVKEIELPNPGVESAMRMTTYGGLLEVLGDMSNDKYTPAQQKVVLPTLINMVRARAEERKAELGFDGDAEEIEIFGDKKLVEEFESRLNQAQVRDGTALRSMALSLKSVVEMPRPSRAGYNLGKALEEIMAPAPPRLFIFDVADTRKARWLSSYLVDSLMKRRRSEYNDKPKILLVFDEAQEFIPYESRREDYTDISTQAVETLLRHGRKYYLSGWIAAQRIARLNTNVLQQLHSYFVGTMPRPYDRQVISDTFAIDDVFLERTLNFNNGDWFMASFKATNTQNVPVFFHAENNEEILIKKMEDIAKYMRNTSSLFGDKVKSEEPGPKA
ncbi:MAG: ATP-binding protein [Thermoprotei archaeon]